MKVRKGVSCVVEGGNLLGPTLGDMWVTLPNELHIRILAKVLGEHCISAHSCADPSTTSRIRPYQVFHTLVSIGGGMRECAERIFYGNHVFLVNRHRTLTDEHFPLLADIQSPSICLPSARIGHMVRRLAIAAVGWDTAGFAVLSRVASAPVLTSVEHVDVFMQAPMHMYALATRVSRYRNFSWQAMLSWATAHARDAFRPLELFSVDFPSAGRCLLGVNKVSELASASSGPLEYMDAEAEDNHDQMLYFFGPSDVENELSHIDGGPPWTDDEPEVPGDASRELRAHIYAMHLHHYEWTVTRAFLRHRVRFASTARLRGRPYDGTPISIVAY